MLDQVTPLLRSTVPLLKAASEELDNSRKQLHEPLRDFMKEMGNLGLLDDAPGGARTERSEGARAKRVGRR